MRQTKCFAVVLLLCVMMSAYGSAAPEKPFVAKRGVNVSYWLSQTGARGKDREQFFTERDVAFLDSLGFDHLRIPMDEDHFFDADLNPQQGAFDLLKQAIEWCRKRNMTVVADLHTIRSHMFDPVRGNYLFKDEAEQERLYRMWEIISDQLREYPNSLVAYEILNEPVADTPEAWNRILKRCIEIIREREPERTLLLGSNEWQKFNTVKDLYIPEGDPNVLVCIHYYEPMQITHHQVHFSGVGRYKGPVHYPGPVLWPEDVEALPDSLKADFSGWGEEVYNKERIDAEVKQAVDIAAKHGLKVYCSEFSCFYKVPQADRERWYTDVTDVFEKYGIGYANWEYEGGFGLVFEGKVHPYMIRKLTPRKK